MTMVRAISRGRLPEPASTDSLADRARDLIPFLVEQAEVNEAAQRLLPSTIEALRKAGLLNYWLPACYGGGETWPVETVEIIEAMAYADGSAAWAMMASQAASACAAVYLKADAADHIFGSGLTLAAGQAAPVGKANAVEGGYQLSGKWSYASGVLHADWIHTAGTVFDDGKPRLVPGTSRADTRMFVLPLSQVNLLQGWDVLGLRATASLDYSVDDMFVGEDFTYDIMTNEPLRGGDVYRIGVTIMSQIAHTSFALGTAKRALEEIVTLAFADKRPFNLMDIGGGETFQELYGLNLTRLNAARALQIAYCEELESTIRRAEPPSTRQISQGMLIMHHVHQVAYEIVEFAYLYGGGISLRAGALQRLYRDMSAGMQHVVVSKGRNREAAREVMGMYPGKSWYLGKLV